MSKIILIFILLSIIGIIYWLKISNDWRLKLASKNEKEKSENENDNENDNENENL